MSTRPIRPSRRLSHVISRPAAAVAHAVGCVYEDLEGRYFRGATLGLTPTGLAVDGPDQSRDLVESVLAVEAQPAPAAAPKAALPSLPPSDDPLSAVGDPKKGAKPPPTFSTTSSTGGNTKMFVSVGLEDGWLPISEKAAGSASSFEFRVRPECASGPFPASVTVSWVLSGVATPTQDYDGEIAGASGTGGSVTITVDQSNGTGFKLVNVFALDDNFDEAREESLGVTIDNATATPDADTPGGMDVVVEDPYQAVDVICGDYTMAVELGGAPAPNPLTLDVDGNPGPKTQSVNVVVTKNGEPVSNLPVDVYGSVTTNPPAQLLAIDNQGRTYPTTEAIYYTASNGKANIPIRGDAVGNQTFTAEVENEEMAIQWVNIPVQVVP